MADLRAQVAKAKSAGYSDAEIAAFLGKDPAFGPKIQQARAAGYKDAEIVRHLSSPPVNAMKNGRLPGEVPFLPSAGAMANFNRGLGIGDELAAGFATAGDVLTGRVRGDKTREFVGNVGNAFARNLAQQRALEDGYAAQRPVTAALARGTGTAVTAAVPAGQTANAFANAPRLANAARGAVVAGTQAAVYGLADRGSASERLSAAGRAAIDPLVLSLGAAGGALGPAARRPARPIDPHIRQLRAEGVELTPGQMRGGVAKSLEDAATSIPIAGDAISAARTRSIEGFNRAAVNRALKPLGTAVPKEVAAGHDAIAYAGDLLSQGYKKALPQGGVRADPGFADDIAKNVSSVIETLRPEGRAQLEKIVQSRVTSRLDQSGKMSGETYQRVQSELGSEIARFSGATDPDARAIGESLQGISNSLKDAAARQNPRFAAKLKQLDEGWAHLTRAETAAKAGGEGGIFTPAQYDRAVRGGDTRVRKRGYARGEALGQDLSSAAKAVLPSKVPDSGTARRLLSGGGGLALGGGATLAGGPVGLVTTASSLAGVSAAYSKRAITLFNQALDRKISQEASRTALGRLRALAAEEPKLAALYREARVRVSRAAVARGAGNSSEQTRQRSNALAGGNP
jgi:hypothetical protein